MKKIVALLSISVALLALGALWAPANQGNAASANLPQYTSDGKLKFPANYREWVYLSSGIDMSYGPGAGMDHSMFDNVFVNPEAYKYFLANGTWPDKTILVLEVRKAETKSAINKAGKYQSGELMGREVHIKDESHFTGKWAFFGFGNNGAPSQMIPTDKDCYTCHAQHTAVDTTFVQFYPTLLEIAKKKGTLSPAYVKEEAAAK
ncbi:MAG TPA: cytochrome P460 family protein [Candidatus Acidoferrum sp.]|nr:cytochrome P460 family protein [Candidatus Acidoferrum sp.]